MPLEPYQRGSVWWARGRIEYDGRPITDYIRDSTGSTTEAGAREWIQIETNRQRRRYIVGAEADQLTFADALNLYDAKPNEAKCLIKIIEAMGDEFCGLPVSDMTGKFISNLGPQIYPNAATDTMWRKVVTPIRAVINNAHELGKCAPVRVKAYKEQVRIDQDTKRGKQSRVERVPADKNWIEAFCAHADMYNAALVRFMFETAARIDQAISIEPADLDLKNKRVRIKAAKGHPEQWVAISHGMMIELANLPPKRPHNRKRDYKMELRVFGYGSRGGYRKSWKSICKNAGIEYISAHSAGRHGFYTELRVRQGVDAITAAKAGRWKNPSLPDQIYAHVETDEGEIRERIRTGSVRGAAPIKFNHWKKIGY